MNTILAVLIVLVLVFAYGWVLWSLHGQVTKRQAALDACETRARQDLARRAARFFVKRAGHGHGAGPVMPVSAPDTGVNDSTGLM